MSDETGLVRMLHPRLGERRVRVKAVGKMRQNGWTVADEIEDEAAFFGVTADDDAKLVRVVKRGMVRHVQAQAVSKMTENGWRVVELETPEIVGERGPEIIEMPPKPKRRRRPQSTTNEPPETDSGGSSLPENEEES